MHTHEDKSVVFRSFPIHTSRLKFGTGSLMDRHTSVLAMGSKCLRERRKMTTNFVSPWIVVSLYSVAADS
jgi:hypothetical protein